jgi:DNA-binding response OmpR family regulator
MRARILVVEDDRDLCEELREILAEEDLRADFANSGDRGLEMARQADYDLVILDLRLPGLSGIEVLRRLNSSDLAPPVLVVTGHPMSDKLGDRHRDEFRQEIARLADGVLSKPFDVSELLSCIRSLLE